MAYCERVTQDVSQAVHIKLQKITITNLGEGQRVQAVLAGDLEANGRAALRVPGGLGAGLDLAVDLVVVAGGEDAQVTGSGDGGAVGAGVVADGGAVVRDSSLADVVRTLGTGDKALVANSGINVGSGTLEEVEVGTAVEGLLLEGQVDLSTLGRSGGQEGEDTLSLEALRNGIGELNLGVKSVGSVPGLSQSKACTAVMH